MNKTQKLVKLIDEMCSACVDCCVKAVKLNPNGSIANTVDILSVITEDKNSFGSCIGGMGEICMTIQPLEKDAKIIITDEYIEVTGSTSGKWIFYPDNTKSVFDLIAEHE